MSRKILLMTFLLIFVASDSALARRHCRSRFRRSCPPVPCAFPVPEPSEGAHYCLRDIYMDFPGGSADLFFCLAYDNGCANNQEYEELWYGNPTFPLPQSCDHNPIDCEFEPFKFGAGRPPGHETLHPPFTNKTEACTWIQNNGNPGATCKYMKISHSSLPRVFYAVAVPSPGGGIDYFGVETQSLPDPVEVTPAVTKPRRKGNVLYFKFAGGTKKALIWLR